MLSYHIKARIDKRQAEDFTVSSPALCRSARDLLQGGDIVLKAQAAGVDLRGVFHAHIAPVPGLIGDLGLLLGPLGVAQDEPVFPGVLAEPAEGSRVLKALVQAGVLGLFRSAARPQLCSE